MIHNQNIVVQNRRKGFLFFICFVASLYFFACLSECQPMSQSDKIKELHNSLRKGLSTSQGRSLLEVLSNKEITLKEKNALCNELELAVRNIRSPFQMPLVIPLDSLPKDKQEKVRVEQNEIKELVQQLGELQQKIIAKELRIAEVFDENGITDLACIVFRSAVAREEGFGIGGEKKEASFADGEFEWKLLQNGERLMRVLASPLIPLSIKKDILLNLREAVSKGGFLP